MYVYLLVTVIYKLVLWLVMTRLSDVVYKLKRTGPKTDPCGIPNGLFGAQAERESNMLIFGTGLINMN